VFVASIDGIRRIVPLLELLKLKAFPLHSQLEQRQRLKNLDRFKSAPNGILIATDVAARGLDIPAVDHVIHYQVPRTADTYVHRNGRTARANREGLALVMTTPEERKMTRNLFMNLGRSRIALPFGNLLLTSMHLSDETDIGEIDIDHDILNKLKARVQLAREIDKAQHRISKHNHEKNWMKETAEALDVILDSDEESDCF
jgi:ATP-dependent RNA helicase DDX24/MAK5